VICGKPGWKTELLQQRILQHPELGRHLFWLYDASDEAQAAKKQEACSDLMRVFDVLDPGLSQSRGMTQIEAVRASVGRGGEHADRSELEAQVKLIKDCLQVEPETTLPGKALRNFLANYSKP